MVKQTDEDKAARGYRPNDRVRATGRSVIGGALPPKAFVVGFELKGRPFAMAIDDLRNRDSQQLNAGETPVIVVPTNDRLSAKVFLATSNGQGRQEVPAVTRFWFAQFTFSPTTEVLRP
jgi:hypothetical protein